MRSSARAVLSGAFILLIAVLAMAGTPGSFRGTIVDGPLGASGSRWIYVQGRNGAARRVEVSHARVSYDEAVAAAGRQGKAADALVPGAEVRVHAEQDAQGEWKASWVEILKTAAASHSRLLLVPQSKETDEILARLVPDLFARHA